MGMELDKKVINSHKQPVRLRTKRLSDGSESLYLDIYVNGVRKYEFLKLYLRPEATKRIRDLNKTTLDAAEAIRSQRIVDLAEGKMATTRRGKRENISLEEWLETFRDLQERKGILHIEKLRSAGKVILQYRHQGKHGKILLHKIDKEWLTGFIQWLQNDYKMRNGKPLSRGTMIYYLSQLSAMLNVAMQLGKINENPFIHLSLSEKIRKPESQRQFLTVEELKRLVKTECRNKTVKDAYLFSCYSGLRISDIRQLTFDNIIYNNRQPMLALMMKKTKRQVYIPLSRQALRLIPVGKYLGNRAIFHPLPCLTTINSILKKWSRDAGIDKHITYHTSRHTFGTLMITAGADLYVTSKLMGHSDVRTTQIYAKIIDSKKIEAITKVERLLIRTK